MSAEVITVFVLLAAAVVLFATERMPVVLVALLLMSALLLSGIVTPDGKKVYAANSLSNEVSVINTAPNRVVKTIKVGDGPWGIAMGR